MQVTTKETVCHSNKYVQKHTTIAVLVNPAKADCSIFVALTKAQQKGPRCLCLQQQPSSLPAHEAHDGSEIHIEKDVAEAKVH